MSATAGPRHAGATLAIDLGAIRSKLPPAPPSARSAGDSA